MKKTFWKAAGQRVLPVLAMAILLVSCGPAPQSAPSHEAEASSAVADPLLAEIEAAGTARLLELLAGTDGAYTEGCYARLGALFLDDPEAVLGELRTYTEQYALAPEGKADPHTILSGLGQELYYMPASEQKEQACEFLDGISEQNDLYEIAAEIAAYASAPA